MQTTKPPFFLFIEPGAGQKNSVPIIDSYTRKITGAFRVAVAGTSGYGQQFPHFCKDGAWRGFHMCECGTAHSSNQEYLIPTKNKESRVIIMKDSRSFMFGKTEESTEVQAVITNSLCIHYVACHRDVIPAEMLEEILLLEGEEAEPTEREIMAQRIEIAQGDTLRSS